MKISRRSFALGALSLGLPSCGLEAFGRNKPKMIIYGPESDRGHCVRDGDFSNFPIQKNEEILQTLVVGGGVAGLSALKQLNTLGIKNLLLLELGRQVGGNARAGDHLYGKHPWGAHYLPIPNKENRDLIQFLYQAEAIFDFDKEGRPFYNEEYLIHAPESSLYRYGSFQNGLFPNFSTAELGEGQKQKFYNLLASYRNLVTDDGLAPFDIPIANSSKDRRILALDEMSGKNFLESNGISDIRVHWYCDYSTRDDYGTSLKDVSAWALLHYFLARSSYKANNTEQDILTWPEGNNWLVQKLIAGLERYIQTDQIVVSISKEGQDFLVKSYSVKESILIERKARSVVCAMPEFVAKKVLQGELLKSIPVGGEYNPWVVNNLILKSDTSYEVPWDSVSYHSRSLGFVKANHQDLFRKGKGTILTHYNALVDIDPTVMRHELFSSTEEELASAALGDLKSMYPKLVPEIEEVRLWIWAHAMRKVCVGSMKQSILCTDIKSNPGFYYAHTDRSGISIFEEAFYQGHNAAKVLDKYLKV